jgi:vacuolar protein-sorting-associated protein 4
MVDGVRRLTPCSPGDPDALEMTYNDVGSDELLATPVRPDDLLHAVEDTKPALSAADKLKHQEWTENYGREGG